MTEEHSPYYVEMQFSMPEELAPDPTEVQLSTERVILAQESGGILVALTVPDADNAGIALAKATGKAMAVLSAAVRARDMDVTVPKPWHMSIIDQKRMHRHLTAPGTNPTPAPTGVK